MARKLRIRVDHNVCGGNAMCESIAPQVFDLNANRQSEAVKPANESRKSTWRWFCLEATHKNHPIKLVQRL